MTRNEAISIISTHELLELSKEMREDILLNWWTIDKHSLEFKTFPELLQKQLIQLDEPDDVMNNLYDDLIMIALKSKFTGVKNEYLSMIISKMKGRSIVVEGNVEKLVDCPCCHFQTLKIRGEYEICLVCFWEDDGTNDTSSYSSTNHMTLSKAQYNFSQIGAMSESVLRFIEPDIKLRYFYSGGSSV